MNAEHNKDYKRIKLLAQWLDNEFQGPWGIRFGLDPLIGLIPVIGALITRSISVYIIYMGMKISQGSWLLLYKMSFNIMLESILEMIPFVGSVFDIYYKANIKNIRLIDSYVSKPQAMQVSLKWHLTLVILALAFVSVVSSFIAYSALKAIISLFG